MKCQANVRGDDCILYFGYIVWLSVFYCCFSWRNFRNTEYLDLASQAIIIYLRREHDHRHTSTFTLVGRMLEI